MAVLSTLKFSYLFVLGTTLLTQVGVGYWVYRYQREQRGAVWFLVMVGTGTSWVGSMTLALVLSRPLFQKLAYGVGHLGIILTVGSFIIFVSVYTGLGFHHNRLIQGSLLGTLAGYLVLAPTNSLHHLIFEFSRRSEPFAHLAIVRGRAYWAMALLVQLLVLYSIYRLAEHLLATQRRGGIQLVLFVLGALSVLGIENASQWTDVLPVAGFPHATLGMFVFYVCTALALFRFRLLDAKPVARTTVIEDLQNPVLVVDERNRVVDYNEAATDVWPALHERIREPFSVACPDLAHEVALEPTESATRVTLTRGGETRYYAATVSAVTVGGETTGWHSVLLRDVTELQRSRDQLEAQNERLNKVASTVSHDLRNPINVAAGHVQLLETKLDDDELLDHVETARRTHDRMLDIIDDILTLAREGETVEETERVDLAGVAREAWEHTDTREGTLTVERDCLFRADRSKLLTIFENLFRNAFDHGPDDATVTVGVTETGFYVADDGPGIAGDTEDIFEFGYTTDDEGTGLGLSIVQTMSESHGWTVELDTDYDEGARFVFSGVMDAQEQSGDTEAVA
jgi:signal transduction histidine kinase